MNDRIKIRTAKRGGISWTLSVDGDYFSGWGSVWTADNSGGLFARNHDSVPVRVYDLPHDTTHACVRDAAKETGHRARKYDDAAKIAREYHRAAGTRAAHIAAATLFLKGN